MTDARRPTAFKAQSKVGKGLMTEQEIAAEKAKINRMTRLEMCRLYRFAEPGHPYFSTTKPFWDVFEKRFNELGGFSPEISKQLGWGDGRD